MFLCVFSFRAYHDNLSTLYYFHQLEKAIASGSINKAQVADMERAMGVNLRDMISSYDSAGPQEMAQIIESLGPHHKEMIAVFRKLAGIK